MDWNSLQEADRKFVWHPFTSAAADGGADPVIVVEGEGVWLRDSQGRSYLDGNASIWCNLHGHRHPRLDAALRAQAAKIAHSSFLGLGNEPAALLARALVETLRGEPPLGFPPEIQRSRIPARVFYSDNGSCANEIAAKMAVQYFRNTGRPERTGLVAFEGGYHGDTMLNVSLGGIGVFGEPYRALALKLTIVSDIGGLREHLWHHGDTVAAVFLESALGGAGGIHPHRPGFMKEVADLTARAGALLVVDEVLAGFGRTGTFLGCYHDGVCPDFITLSKGLTAGYLPLAVTLAREEVYQSFAGDYYSGRILYHGHTYTGNPLACAVALENLKMFREENIMAQVASKIPAFEKGIRAFEGVKSVREVRSIGLIGGIELEQRRSRGDLARAACLAARQHGVLTRPLGNTIVVMPPLCISLEHLAQLFDGIRAGILQTAVG